MGFAQDGADAQRLDNQAARRKLTAEAAYRLAKRHSRVVKLLRWAIPIGAVVSFSAFIVFPFINPFRIAGVSIGAVKMDGTRVTMENPRLAGHRKDNKPYEVTAASAVQDIRVPNVIELSQMKARIVNTDDGVLNLSARTAVFDSQKEQLRLKDDVRVTTQAGQEALLKSADVDFKAGTVRSNEGVTVRLPDMSVTADALDIVDSGAKIAFIGRVSALIDDKDTEKAQSGARPAQPLQRQSGLSSAVPRSPDGASTQTKPVPPTQQVRDARGFTVVDPSSGLGLQRPNP